MNEIGFMESEGRKIFNLPRLRQVIAIPDDDEKSPSAEQEKKNGEPMETDKPSNGETEGVKEKEGEKMEEGEGEKKSPEGAEETKPPSEAKTEGSEVKPEDAEVKGKTSHSGFFLF